MYDTVINVTYTQISILVSVWGVFVTPLVWYTVKQYQTLQTELSALKVEMGVKITRGEASQLIASSINGLEKSVDQLHTDIRLLITNLIENK